MPYKSIQHLPTPVHKAFSVRAQRVYKDVFNASLAECLGDEQKAARLAWEAAKDADGLLPTFQQRQRRAAHKANPED